MPTHDLYPVSERQSAPSGVYFDTAAAARGESIRSSVYGEIEFARGVHWALRQRDDDPVARAVLRGVPDPPMWRRGVGDWVVTGGIETLRVVCGRVPVLGSLVVADEFGGVSQVEEKDVAWLFRMPMIAPSSAMIPVGVEFVRPDMGDDIAWRWCMVEGLGPSLAVTMFDESTVAVLCGRLFEVSVDRVRVAVGGVSAWDTVADAGVAVRDRALSPSDRRELQHLVDNTSSAEFGTDRYCALEYLLRVAYGTVQ